MSGTTLLTVREAAATLRVSKLTVYRAVADGRLRAYRLGGNGPLRISSRALAEFCQPALVRRREDER